MDYYKESLKVHEEKKGKIEVISKLKVENKDDLSIAYTPGVAEPCRKIAENKDDVYRYTIKKNTVAVVSDGSAVLGLGNIGAHASIPVMEGKALLFKEYGDVDAFPICLDTQNSDEIINHVKAIAPVFGGINLEDISAPRCFEIENKLQDLGIPVFHDDQHGTAVVTLAGLINALKIVNKNISDIKITINGAGAAGVAITKILLKEGVKDIVICDSKGIISKSREDIKTNESKVELSEITNKDNISGTLLDAITNSDVFIGVSKANLLKEEHIKAMNEDPIIFAMANPHPEVMPDDAKNWGAKVIATGRSDFANQINNVLAFPGIFRGALDAGAKRITENMKIAAAYAIADYIETPTVDEIIPSPLDKKVAENVAVAVANAWKE